MYKLSRQILGSYSSALSTSSPLIVLDNFEWSIKWYSYSGGLKKYWLWGMEDVPIKTFSFELNKKLMGNASFEFTNIDFLIHSFDKVQIFYDNTLQYTGYVDSLPDVKGGKINLIPITKQLEEKEIDLAFSNYTPYTMFKYVLSNYSSLTDIIYNPLKISSTASTVVYIVNFGKTNIKKIFDDINAFLPNTEWGVDENNHLNVYYPSTTLAKIITSQEEKWYSNLDYNVNDDRIDATRYQVTMKGTTSGQTIYCGQVGYDAVGGTYPTLSIEKIKRRIDKFYNISMEISTLAALDIAYKNLKKNATLSENITLSNFRYDKYNPAINTYIKIIDELDKVLFPFKDIAGNIMTDSTTYWDNITFSSTDYIQGEGCICFSGTNPVDSLAYFDFGENKHYKNMEYILFMIKSDSPIGKCLNIDFSTSVATLFDSTWYNVYINSPLIWEMKKINSTITDFRYMGVRFATTYSGTYNFWIDDVEIFDYIRNEYTGNVVKKKFNFSKDGITMDMELNDYKTQENEDLFSIKERLENIEKIQIE